MKLKKSTLLLIALFSVSVECMYATPKSDSESCTSEEELEEWQNLGEESPIPENEGKDPGGVSSANSEEEVAVGTDSGGSSNLSSDSENDSASDRTTPSTSEDECMAPLLFANPSVEPRDGYQTPIASVNEQAPFTDPFYSNDGQVSSSEEQDPNLLPLPMNSPRNLISKRKNSRFSGILPVAAVFVIGYFLHKLFSGSKKTRNKRRVRPDQRPAGAFNNKATYYYSIDGDQRPAGSY